MRLSDFYLPTTKEVPSDATIISHQLLIRAGLVRQIASGLYTILPLGMRVLNKISNIIREELNAIGDMETVFPIIQMDDAWVRSGRSTGYCGAETLRMKDRHGRDLLFSPTAEESVHLMFEMDAKSYKQLPCAFYQINWKFRDEIRPRFGLMRCREFLMMDSYSFDINEEDATRTYEKFFSAYIKIFQKMGLACVPLKAASGEIGGDLSHEFHIVAENGESAIFYDKKLDEMQKDISKYSISEIRSVYAKTEDEHDAGNCPIASGDLVSKRGIEVGHIFYYGQKYSKAMDIKIQGEDGRLFHPYGGCYGIGVTRLIAATIEASHDDRGIIWPKEIAPFDVVVVNLDPKNVGISSFAEKIYHELSSEYDVLLDDTLKNAGEKLAVVDLIGIPVQIIIGKRSFDNGEYEIKLRSSGKKEVVKLETAPSEALKNML